MEAARVASLRGHQAVLYEKTDRLGGHVAEAAIMPFKKAEARLLNWYKNELDKAGASIYLNQEVNATFLMDNNSEVVIIATGSSPVKLDLQGANKNRVFTAIDVLDGKSEAGKKVIVVGGGRVGCETALWLAQQGSDVTVLEKLNDLMAAEPLIQRMNRLMLLDLLKFHKVNILTNTSIFQVTGNGALIGDGVSSTESIISDTIILSVGLQSEQTLYRSLHDRIPNVYAIGDAREVRNIMGAIWDAYEVARTI